MSKQHPFRFGVVTAVARSAAEWAERARSIESLGYATLVMPDRVQYTFSPLPALAAAASATSTLRVGTYVFANDFRNPVLLAKDAATLDLLSGGRLELGLGAGIAMPEDSRMLGIRFEAGRQRVERLAESVRLLKRLWAGEQVTDSGAYQVEGAQITPRPAQKPHPPILLAGGGRRMLELAAREADIVALSIQPTDPVAAVEEKVRWLREAAAQRFDQLELNLNLMAVGDQVPTFLRTRLKLGVEDLARMGAFPVLSGSTEQMCETLVRWRETIGISYVVVGDELMQALAPVVERLAGR